jgi:hypothetical protein
MRWMNLHLGDPNEAERGNQLRRIRSVYKPRNVNCSFWIYFRRLQSNFKVL